MKKLLRLTKLLLTAALFGVGQSAWATDVPEPVYLLNFEGATAVTDFGGVQHGSGSLVTSSDTRFGTYYQNMPEATEVSTWTNFLEVVPTSNPWATIRTAGTNAFTISFWCNATVANDKNIGNYWGSLFTGYTESGLSAHQWPVGPDVRYLGQFHFNNDGAYVDENGTEEQMEAIGAWDDDNNWHHFAWIFSDLDKTSFTLALYIDGSLKYSRTLSVTGTAKTGINMLDNLDRFTIGGNTPIWENPDNAFGYDDIALYSSALTAEQVAQVIKNKDAVVSASLSDMVGSGKSIYPAYTLSAVDGDAASIASPIFTISDEDVATVSGSTITFKAATTKPLVVMESTTKATMKLTCAGAYERTLNQSFAYNASNSVPTGVKNIYYNQTPTGFKDNNITVFQTTFSPGGGEASYPQYFKSLGFDAGKTAGTNVTVKLKFFQNFGLQTADQIFNLSLLSPLAGQIVKISSYKGEDPATQTLAEAGLTVDYEFVSTPGGNYNTHTTTIAIDNYQIINCYEVYTPVTYTSIPDVIISSRVGNQNDNADLSNIILTKDNISGISEKIAAGSFASVYLSPQMASDITVDDLRSLVPQANKNTWWFNMPQANYNNRPLSYWRYQKGINVRAYAGSSKWNVYGYALTDGVNYTTGAVTPSQNCSYDRSFTKDIVNTICLPFAIDNTSGDLGTFYTLAETQSGKDAVKFTTVTTTEANKPYLFIPSETGALTLAKETAFSAAGAQTTTVGDFSLVGVQSAQSICSDANNAVYGFSTDGKLIKITTNTDIKGMRAYLKVTGTNPARQLTLLFDRNDATAIKNVDSEKNDNEGYYNLNGQRIASPSKGLYVVNGKKVIMK